VALAATAPLAKAAPSERVNMGFIGLGICGNHLLRTFTKFPDVNPVAVADLYDGYLENAREVTSGKIAAGKDYRAILDRKEKWTRSRSRRRIICTSCWTAGVLSETIARPMVGPRNTGLGIPRRRSAQSGAEPRQSFGCGQKKEAVPKDKRCRVPIITEFIVLQKKPMRICSRSQHSRVEALAQFRVRYKLQRRYAVGYNL
jgi:hypothetical protein